MDKRTAKREAYKRASSLIESAMADGWPSEMGLYSEDDLDKVIDELSVIVAELRRRAGLA